MPEENMENEANKLGTSVTYLDPDQTGKPVNVQGVYLLPNETVDLAEYMDPNKAKQTAERLAMNHFFQVEGGPDHGALREDRERRLFEQQQRVQATARKQAQRRRPAAEQEPEAPENYDAPDQPQLAGDEDGETTTRSRRNRRS